MPTRPFDELRSGMFRLYAERRYGEALALVERESARFPEQWGDVLYWVGCLAAVLGDRQRALRALHEAVDRGHWWSEGMLRGDPDLKSLQGLPAFEALVAACRRRHALAQEACSPRLRVLRPTGMPPYPLLIALHGAGGSAEEFSEHWQPAAEGGWLVAVPQSSRTTAPGRFDWSDRARARDEILEHYGRVTREHVVDSGRVILAGFSQGGGLAMWLASGGVIPARGFLGVACAARDLDEIGALLKTRPVPPRAWLIVGRKDFVHDRARDLATLLRDRGVPTELETPEGLGHEVPADFGRRLPSALRFLTEGTGP